MTFVPQQVLVAPDAQANDQFGSAVALDGETALIAAANSVYVFVRTGSAWSFQQKLTANDGLAGDSFGAALALSGDTALIGAGGDDDERGSAYVFVRTGSTWAQQQKLSAADGAAGQRFGSRLALSGDVALIGAFPEAAYAFTRSGTVWSASQKLVAPSAMPGDAFGWSLSAGSAGIFVGAPFTTGPLTGFMAEGVVYQFHQSGVVMDTITLREEGQELARFGIALAQGGASPLLVGAPSFTVDGIPNRGRVFVGPDSLASLDLPAAVVDSGFGTALAASGNTALVSTGAHLYVFSYTSGAGYTAQQRLVDANGPFAVSGNSVLLGKPTETVGSNTNQGSAVVLSVADTPVGPCSSNSDCPTGFCSDGICCDSACDGACDTCTQALGPNTIGVCKTLPTGSTPANCQAPRACNGGSAACAATCATDFDCAAGFYCSAGGQCLAQKLNGAACNVAAAADCKLEGCRVCQSTQCIEGVCCDRACSGRCETCVGVTPGICSPAADGTAPKQPGCSGYVCDGTNTSCPSSCAVDADCESTHRCASGVCVSKAIEPRLWIQTNKLFASDGMANDRFGTAVAISGNTLVVGAASGGPGKPGFGLAGEGAAYVFVRSGSGWSEQQRLLASDGVVQDQFGRAVAAGPDTVIVTGGNGAYVFGRIGSTWSERQKLVANEPAIEFGWALALSGDTAVVTAPSATVGTNERQGAAYVFERSASGWSLRQKLTADDCAMHCLFGSSVALEGDSMLIGADQSGGGGAAYHFVRANSTWFLRQRFSVVSDVAFFGRAIALDASTALVGNPGYWAQGLQGSAWVFQHSGSIWVQQQKLVSSGWTQFNNFGRSVALSGDVALVGADEQGEARSFVRSDTGWFEQQTLTPAMGAPGEKFGSALALSGDTALIGAVEADGQNWRQGATYVFARTGGACTSAEDCATGFCSDGVCCDSACTGQCQACAETGNIGHCMTVSGAPRSPRTSCEGTGACQGSCGGQDPDSCSYPDSTTECAPASCNADELTPAAHCSGTGVCTPPAPQSCVPYACDATAGGCKTACSTDSDCASGRSCVAGTCVLNDGGSGGSSGTGGTAGTAGTTGTAGAAGHGGRPPHGDPGCHLRPGKRSHGPFWLSASLLLVVAGLLRWGWPRD